MDSERFDALVRAWMAGTPRRTVLGLVAGSIMGLAGLEERPIAAKKKKITVCLSGQTLAVSKKQKAKYLGNGATVGACAGSPPAPPAPPASPPPPAVDTCANGVKDGDETDVDCGGSCPKRCFVRKLCVEDFDCITSNCTGGKCAACESDTQCPAGCTCATEALFNCYNPDSWVGVMGTGCSVCPPRTAYCRLAGHGDAVQCFAYCGETYPA